MTFDQVDDRTDLYQVKNIIPKHLLKELKTLPLEAMPFTKQEWQEHIITGENWQCFQVVSWPRSRM